MATIQLPAGFTKVPADVEVDYIGQSFVSLLDIHEPENSEDFIKRYGNQRLGSLLEMLGGRSVATAQQTYKHWEENFYHSSFEASVASAPTSGYTATTFTIKSDYADANGYTAPRIGDKVLIARNNQTAIITAKPTETTITLKPFKAWSFTSADDSVNIRFVITGREAVEAGTTPNQSLSSKPFEYTNRVQIIDDAYTYSGSERTNKIWFNVEGPDGRKGKMWTLQGENETATRFMNYKEMQMLIGVQADSGSTAYTDGYRGTRGLLPDIETYGMNFDLNDNPIGKADVQLIARTINKYKGAKEYAWFCGMEQYQGVDDFLAAQNANYLGGSHFGMFNNSEDMMINLSFKGFEINGIKFALKNYDLFNHPELLGAEGMAFEREGFLVPMDSGRDAVSGEAIPSIRERYKELGGYSRKYETWVTGGANGVYTNDTDKIKVNYRSECGFEAFGLNRFAKVTA